MSDAVNIDEQKDRASYTCPVYVHILLGVVHLLLILKFVMLIPESSRHSLPDRIADQLALPLYDPFRGTYEEDILEGHWEAPAVIFAMVTFWILHYGIAKAVPAEMDGLMLRRVIDFFRLVFYVSLTLLVMLIVIRTALMLWNDIRRPYRTDRQWILVDPPPQKLK